VGKEVMTLYSAGEDQNVAMRRFRPAQEAAVAPIFAMNVSKIRIVCVQNRMFCSYDDERFSAKGVR
jgi:hypothetical protein